jgi:hypothetical protein
MPRARLGLAGLALLALIPAGCGGSSGDAGPRRAVRLELTGPVDAGVVRQSEVQVRGTVTPARGSVRILGRSVPVVGGAFATTVALSPGPNVIDVTASAPDTRPALTAVRVIREVTVRVPELAGAGVQDAETQLADLGLRARVQETGGLLDPFLPGDPQVCDQSPAAGTRVRRGARVRLLVARSC